MNSKHFNKLIDEGRANADGNLQALERGYRITLQAAARHAGDRFAALSTDHLTADITDPKWSPPENDQLIDPAAMAADAQKRTQPARHAALKAVMGPALADIGVAYDLTNPLVAGLIDTLGVRAQDMGDAVRGDVAKAVLNAYQQGLSVVDAAKGIQAAVEGIAPARAAMLARTDLIGLANGASVAAAQLVAGSDESSGGLGFKQWLATEDERTRETHSAADGQIVPLEQTFTVGSDQLAYPGDPDGSDEEVCNCRCTVVYLDAAEAAGQTGEEASALSAAMQAPTGDVPSRGHMSTSPDDTLTADVTITVADDSTDDGTVEQQAVPTRWRAILCIEGQETQDNATLSRMLAVGETTWRDLPIPLGVMYETPHSDEVDAELCGLIDTIYRDEYDFRVIWGEGAFNADEQGQRAAARIGDLSLRGVSIDPYVPEVEIFDTPADTENGVAHSLVVMHNAVICAATVCPVQAIDGAQISLIASTEAENIMPLRRDTCFVLIAATPPPPAPVPPPPDLPGGASALDVLTASTEAERISVVERAVTEYGAFTTALSALTTSVESLEQRSTQREAFNAAIVDVLKGMAAPAEQIASLTDALTAAASRDEALAALGTGQKMLVEVVTALAAQVEQHQDAVSRLVAAVGEEKAAAREAYAALGDALAAKLAAITEDSQEMTVLRDDAGRLIGVR